jgi:hypothetical protein
VGQLAWEIFSVVSASGFGKPGRALARQKPIHRRDAKNTKIQLVARRRCSVGEAANERTEQLIEVAGRRSSHRFAACDIYIDKPISPLNLTCNPQTADFCRAD